MARWFDGSHENFYAEFEAFLQERESDAPAISADVAEIIRHVRGRGDAALCDYTAKWDNLTLTPEELQVSPKVIEASYAACDKSLVEALQLAAERIYDYHQRQMPQDHTYTDDEGNMLGWRWRAVPEVGLYVPGGKAVYPSSVLMNAMPAKAAGVSRLAMVVPMPGGVVNDVLLAAAKVAGIGEIYAIGGAQAVAALAYGTSNIAKVDKIVGPGNAYVAEAKRQVFGKVGIDMIAGPSEICVVADTQNDPEWQLTCFHRPSTQKMRNLY